MIICAAGRGLAADSIRVDDNGTVVTIATADYRAVLSREKGFTLTSLIDVRAKRTFRVHQAGLVLVEERERETWAEAGFGQPTRHYEWTADATTVIDRQEGTVIGASTWKCAAAEVRGRLTFRSDSPVIEMEYAVRVLRPLEEIAWFLQVNDSALSREGRFYPGSRRYVAREPAEARFVAAPGYAYCHDGRSGVGLFCPADSGALASIAYSTLGPSLRRTHFACYTPPLRWRKVPFELTFRASLVVGVTPGDAAALHRTLNPRLEPVEIAELTLEKLLHRTTEPGRARVLLRNNTDRQQEVVLNAAVVGGIDEGRNLPEQSLLVPAFGERSVPLEWRQQGEWGFELQTAIATRDGVELDAAREYFGVTDHFVNMGQTTVWNAGWMRYDWLTPAMVEKAKDSYVGVIEYYCWAPDQVFDLTPDTEIFEPHTESQGSYRTQLTRTFLRDLVSAAHRSGLYVNAMDTGFASLEGALRHPERVKYTADGQIYLYNGNIHDGKRFNAVGAHVFTPDAIRAWAEEMNASVDMFGWDGVRFDWNFIPIAEQDPLAMAAAKKSGDVYGVAKRTSWYTVDGTSAHELFPEPDKSAAEFCRLWRATVAREHPDFIYNVNYSVNAGVLDEYPRYSEANCTNAGVLMESLLNVWSRFPTWQEWAAVLTGNMRTIRPLRAQPFVGWMRGYAPGGVAHRNIHYIMMASGFRWYGPYGPRHSLDGTAERFRHALRFAEYFYDPDFVPRADPDGFLRVEGQGVERVLWKAFVFERRRGTVREVLVHMINLPRDDPIIMRHELPEAKRDLTVTIRTGAAGGTPSGGWLLIPEPLPRAIPLDLRIADRGTVVIEVPELLSLGSVLLRLEGGREKPRR